MNKRIIAVLVVVMSVASIGLIVVQAYWIQNAIKVKEEQFNQMISSVLTEVVMALEAQETTKQMEYQMVFSNNIEQNKILSKILNSKEFKESDEKKIKLNQEYSFHKNDSIDINSNISIFKEDSLIYNHTDSVFKNNQEIKRHVQSQLKNKVQFAENVLNKILFSNKDIQEKIDPEFIDNKVRNSLLNKGLDLKFQFAVVDHQYNVVYQTPDYNPNSKYTKYTIPLFPNDWFSRPSWLVVYFPEAQKHIRPLSFMVTSSVFLTLTIILTFSFTIFIILKQKKLSEIKNDFINNMTHELKTPIATISLASQMLKDDSIPVEMKNVSQISGIIEDESKRLSSHVEKVLQMAVLDKGVRLKSKELDINEIVTNVSTNIRIQVEAKGGVLHTETCNDSLLMIGDQVHITNVIANLLDNAMKYTTQLPEIHLRTQLKNGWISISVKDNGIGISKDNQKKIFEKFYRVGTGNIHNVKGFGLGLSYVKKIVDAHRGQISVQSELNKGTTFEILFPEKSQLQKIKS